MNRLFKTLKKKRKKRKQDSELNPHIHSQPVIEKGAKQKKAMGKVQCLQQILLGKTGETNAE